MVQSLMEGNLATATKLTSLCVKLSIFSMFQGYLYFSVNCSFLAFFCWVADLEF